MRKYIKKRLIELVSTVVEATDIIKLHVEKNEIEPAIALMAEMQKTAVDIGNEIERSEGTETETVRLLEEYCDLLWQCSEAKQKSEQLEVCKLLKRKTVEIEISLNRIPEQYDIVFLPYKASMWDSLESIWLAAKEDKDCSCYVIPIPYYDKNPDGSFGQMHYEGDQFPCYVPVADYNSYDLQANHPEVIYFHNPYDQHNFLTSVHPAFYSSMLKKYTDMLVYVPYFVHLDHAPEHLSVTSGVLNAHKVIVQTDRIRESYIHSLMKALVSAESEKDGKSDTGNKALLDEVKKYAENKFLALGSPKLDKVLYFMEHKPEMPKNWEDFIRAKTGRTINEDISDIKLILYNTHISSLVNHGEVFLKKLRHVFELFESRNDCVLLWRPHPLSVETAETMDLKWKDEYKGLVKEYKERKIGIFDDSADVHYSIALSDIYYGDMSSLVMMYGVTGKPIILQDLKQRNNKPFDLNWAQYLAMHDYAEFHGKKYFPVLNYNALFSKDTASDKIDFLGLIPKERLFDRHLYGACTINNGKLYMAPMNAKEIAVYDLSSGQFKKIPLKDCNEKMQSKFYGIIKYGDYVLLIPCRYHSVVKINTLTDEVEYLSQWHELIKDYSIDGNPMYFKNGALIKDGVLYLAAMQTNIIVMIDIDSGCTKTKRVGVDETGFCDMAYDGNDFWLSPYHGGYILKWNESTGEVFKYSEFPEGFEPGSIPFINIIPYDDFVIAVSYQANMSLKIIKSTGSAEALLIDETLDKQQRFTNVWNARHYFGKKVNEEEVLISSIADNSMHSMNLRTGDIKHRYLYYEFNLERYKIAYNKKSKSWPIYKQCIIHENPALCLDSLLNIKIDRHDQKQIDAFSNLCTNLGQAGKKIFDVTKNLK